MTVDPDTQELIGCLEDDTARLVNTALALERGLVDPEWRGEAVVRVLIETVRIVALRLDSLLSKLRDILS